MWLYLVALTIDTILLLILGSLDLIRGESRLDTTILVYVAPLIVYYILPLSFFGKILLYIFQGGIFAVILLIYKIEGNMGLMDIVIASQAPLMFSAVYIKTIIPAVISTILVLIAFIFRAKRYTCDKTPLPGSIVKVKSWLAWNKWYFVPVNILNPEQEDSKIKEIKESWKKKKKCEQARFGIPLVGIYSVFQAGIILSFITYLFLGIL